MYILFIEDEEALLATAVEQLESKGYVVYPVLNLAGALEVMLNPAMPVNLVIADYHLADGFGLDFVIKMKAQFPSCLYAIVSGCLTDANVRYLQAQGIPYYHKPLLYRKVVEDLRRGHLLEVPCPVVAEPVVEMPIVEGANPVSECAEVEEASVEASQALEPKKWFGLFCTKRAQS
jgi:CheY-like chemotaxis protein